MFDTITLDQLRAFVAVVEEGSFSAAARKVQRVQSAVSHAMAKLEAELGVPIWDRSEKIPKLTEQGQALLAAARGVCAQADALRRLADTLVGGLEPRVSICVDAIFPLRALVGVCQGFAREFPSVQLRVQTETLAQVATRVLDGSCHLGVGGPTANLPGLERVHLAAVRLVPVVAKEHPLARHRGRLATARLQGEVQIVLSERFEPLVPDQGVLSLQTWRVMDLGTKHELIRAGLGWGNMPEHMIRDDVREGRLVRLRPAAWGEDEHLLPLSLLSRPGFAQGPATRWLIQTLGELCLREAEPDAVRRARGRRYCVP